MKILKRSLILLVVVIGVVVYLNYPKLNIISGYASKNMASGVFVADRTAASLAQHDNNVPLIELADTEVDTDHKWASASVYGLMNRKAVYREGLGTVLVNDDYDEAKPFRLLSGSRPWIPSPTRMDRPIPKIPSLTILMWNS